MSNLNELLAQKAELEKRIEEATKTARADAIAQVKALMAEHGLTESDISSKSSGRGVAKKFPTGKIAVKFRDAATGESWTGRGLQPKWLRAALANGRNIEEFRV